MTGLFVVLAALAVVFGFFGWLVLKSQKESRVIEERLRKLMDPVSSSKKMKPPVVGAWLHKRVKFIPKAANSDDDYLLSAKVVGLGRHGYYLSRHNGPAFYRETDRVIAA